MLTIKETKVTKKGNGVAIYIPAVIRDELGIGEGDTVCFIVDNGKVVIVKK